MKKVVALVSGGVDSVIMAKLYPEAVPVFVKYQNSYLERELEVCQNLFGDSLVVIDVTASKPDINQDQVFVPDRNMTLASLAVTVLDADVVMMAGLRDDNAVDKNPQAFEMMTHTLSTFAGKDVTVISPFFNKTKGQVVEMFLNTWISSPSAHEILNKTYSCYSGHDDECGECEACFRKWAAFRSNDIDIPYTPPREMIEKYLLKIHEYDHERAARLFIALKADGYMVHAWDIDGTLAMEKWDDSHETYSQREVLRDNRNELIRQAANDKNIIVLYTARLEGDRQITRQWLAEKRIPYDALIMNKLPYTYLYDDRAITK